MKHSVHCIPPDEVGARGQCVCDGTKGQKGRECNRSACGNEPATWWSGVERAWYCQPCAFKINDYLPPGVPKLVRLQESEDAQR